MEWVDAILSILTGLIICIPLIIKICSLVKDSIKNKNWNLLISLVLDEMKHAQEIFATGGERKEYVMHFLNDLALKANYSLDDEDIAKVSRMIDELCEMANVVGIRK